MNVTSTTELLLGKTFSFYVLITNDIIIITDCTSVFQSTLFKSFEATLKAKADIALIRVMDLGMLLSEGHPFFSS